MIPEYCMNIEQKNCNLEKGKTLQQIIQKSDIEYDRILYNSHCGPLGITS